MEVIGVLAGIGTGVSNAAAFDTDVSNPEGFDTGVPIPASTPVAGRAD